ncbi:MAG: hypothetical protein HFH68_01340 [Lachnospiraceae bacterium]|nr:hypothetical protein [Lachnospiraceae bacterium]
MEQTTGTAEKSIEETRIKLTIVAGNLKIEIMYYFKMKIIDCNDVVFIKALRSQALII